MPWYFDKYHQNGINRFMSKLVTKEIKVIFLHLSKESVIAFFFSWKVFLWSFLATE